MSKIDQVGTSDRDVLKWLNIGKGKRKKENRRSDRKFGDICPCQKVKRLSKFRKKLWMYTCNSARNVNKLHLLER